MSEINYNVDRTDQLRWERDNRPNDGAEAVEAAEEHILTNAELVQFAADKGIDLGDATRKADIRAAIFAGLNVAELRAFARNEGTELHGAQSRADILAALGSTEEAPAVAEPEAPISGNTFTSNFGNFRPEA